MMNYTAVLLVMCFLMGCSSAPDPKEDFDEQLKSKTTDDKEQVGLKDDKVMIKKKIYMEEQLFKLKRESEDLENSIYGRSKKDPGGLWAALKDCRTRLADPRVGGGAIRTPWRNGKKSLRQNRIMSLWSTKTRMSWVCLKRSLG